MAVDYIPRAAIPTWPAADWYQAWDDIEQSGSWEDGYEEGMDEATAPLRAALRKAYAQHTDPAYVYAIIVAASRITAIGRADIEALSSQNETVYDSWGEIIASELKESGSNLDFHHLNDAGIDYMKSMIKSDGEIWVDSGDKRHQFSDLSQLFMFTDPNYGSR